MASDAARAPGGQEWLTLRVAFGDAAGARAAWAELEPVLDIDGIAHDAHGVFPQLADALRRMGAQPPVMPRLDGVRKRAWTRTSLRLREVASAVSRLEGAGVAATAGGGLAVLLSQDDLSRRPLVEAELVVEGSQAPVALAALEGDRWRAVSRRTDGWLMDLRAVVLERGGHQVTLRWSDGTWPYLTGAGIPPTARSGPLEIAVATPADLLVYTLAEGFRLWGYTPTRRYADALMLLAGISGTAWDDVLALTAARRAEPPVAAALERIAADFPHAVPGEVRDALRARSSGLRSRAGLAADLRSGALAVLLRRTSDRSLVRALAAAPAELLELRAHRGERATPSPPGDGGRPPTDAHG